MRQTRQSKLRGPAGAQGTQVSSEQHMELKFQASVTGASGLDVLALQTEPELRTKALPWTGHQSAWAGCPDRQDA